MADPDLLGRAVTAAVEAAQLPPTAGAAVALAQSYAAAIDESDGAADVLTELGPKLLAALTALGLTMTVPAAKGGAVVPAASPLDELRARRARKSRAPGMDAAAP